MSPNTKHLLSLLLLGVGILLEIHGVSLLAGSFGNHAIVVKGAIYTAAGLLIGLPAILYHCVYQASQNKFSSQEKIDVETLAALGKDPKPPARKR